MQPYDRYDAFLHHIFRQTQGDAWFRPDEGPITGGVCLRVTDSIHNPEWRVFPYENADLEPFQEAVSRLNPAVAVKVRSAAVHAALSDVPPHENSVYVDSNTRIQVLDNMSMLAYAEKDQSAAFIRDEHVLVVWTDSPEAIIPTCADFDARLIKLLWRARPLPLPSSSSHTPNTPNTPNAFRGEDGSARGLGSDVDVEKQLTEQVNKKKTDSPWWSRSLSKPDDNEKREVALFAPVYNGLAAGLALVFIGNGIKIILQEIILDGNYTRLALFSITPFLFCVSLFFALQIFQNVTMALGPIAHYHSNSRYYSAHPPVLGPDDSVDERLPHVTIQMPVYKESLDVVLTPSIMSIKKAMQTYARQGGSSSIFINDDGMRVISPDERDARITFYATHGIGWVARPAHGDPANNEEANYRDRHHPVFKRPGRFKKASNMNYGLELSLKIEKHLEKLVEEELENEKRERGREREMEKGGEEGVIMMKRRKRVSSNLSYGACGSINGGVGGSVRYGMQYCGDQASLSSSGEKAANDGVEDTLEERALALAMEEMWEESGRRWRPWAANGKACRVGEIVLLVDSDSFVPEDCLRDAAREMAKSPNVGIIQHESEVTQVAHHYFENGIAYFTRRINRCISMTCANGEIAPFMGHNAFLRWNAVQDAAYVDPTDGKKKVWSESNVSEDFDLAMRLQARGYILRWATYSKGEFREGVSLTVDDELNRWQKYAYGCNELLFNPLKDWWRRGPISARIRRFLWCDAPLHHKISMLAYMFSYYGIAASVTAAIVNYIVLGFGFPVDGYYFHSWEIYLASVVIFFGSGTVGYTLLEYRLGKKQLVWGLLENLMWIPFFFFFFGGLPIPLTQAILAHLFSYNIQWTMTKKEVERSNFFKEVPKIARRFWFPLLVSVLLLAGMIVCSTSAVPAQWHVSGEDWAVIVPLSIAAGCHILFPIVLNPWLMIFSY